MGNRPKNGHVQRDQKLKKRGRAFVKLNIMKKFCTVQWAECAVTVILPRLEANELTHTHTENSTVIYSEDEKMK